jgi:predicted MFS family arabinose efflux permease
MNFRQGYRRIVLVLAGVAGLVGMVAGVSLTLEESLTSEGPAIAVLRIVGGLVLIPCAASLYTGLLLWFGGLGICRLIAWVANGFRADPDSEMQKSHRVGRGTSPLRITGAVVAGLAVIVVVAIGLTVPTNRQPARESPRRPSAPQVPLCDIPTEDIEG